MIGIAAPSFDTEGAHVLQENPNRTNLGDIKRRVTRRATLDGGAAFEDRGSFDADRSFTVVLPSIDRDLALTLKRLVETYRWLLVSTAEGLYRVAPQNATIAGDEVRLSLLVESKRSAE